MKARIPDETKAPDRIVKFPLIFIRLDRVHVLMSVVMRWILQHSTSSVLGLRTSALYRPLLSLLSPSALNLEALDLIVRSASEFVNLFQAFQIE